MNSIYFDDYFFSRKDGINGFICLTRVLESPSFDYSLYQYPPVLISHLKKKVVSFLHGGGEKKRRNFYFERSLSERGDIGGSRCNISNDESAHRKPIKTRQPGQIRDTPYYSAANTPLQPIQLVTQGLMSSSQRLTKLPVTFFTVRNPGHFF